VAIVDLTSGRGYMHNADEIFPVASSIKLAVLAELYHQAEQAAAGTAGKATLTDLYTMDAADLVEDSPVMAGLTPGVSRVTNRDLASFMVTVSDNAATNVLIGRLGMDNVNALLAAQGLKETRLRRRMLDLAAAREGRENTSTPREMASLLEALYRGRVLGKALTDDLFKLLSAAKDKYIPRGLPADVVVANKPGWLDGVRTDSGIVFAKDRPFVISVMTTYVADETAAEATIARIAAAAWRHFDRLGRASPYGRLLSGR
jgi:beta-lactamase class A